MLLLNGFNRCAAIKGLGTLARSALAHGPISGFGFWGALQFDSLFSREHKLESN